MNTYHKTTPKSEHGTTRSYIIGYILSLVFTIIPYYLVVNKTISGTALLMAILGVAILQMFIQIFFFLHLGRGPKPLYNVVFFFATVGIILIAVGGSLFIMNNLYRNMSPDEVVRKLAQKEGISQVGGEETGACQGNKNNHIVTIKDGKASPASTDASRCDTLTFINQDTRERTIIFGSYPEQVSYGGEYEVILETGKPETITLNQSGGFVFYDNLEPTATGDFTVSP